MKPLIIALPLLLAACASYAPKEQLAEAPWQTLTCSGFKTWNDCRTQALASCPRGFYIANELENVLIQRRQVEVACKA